MKAGRRSMKVATGFDFESLEDGTVLIEFFDAGGVTLNEQVVTREAVQDFPFIAALTELCLQKGPEAVARFMKAYEIEMR